MMPRSIGARWGVKSTELVSPAKVVNACSISGVCRCVSSPYGVIFPLTAQNVVFSLGGLPAPLTPVMRSTIIEPESIVCDCTKGARAKIAAAALHPVAAIRSAPSISSLNNSGSP